MDKIVSMHAALNRRVFYKIIVFMALILPLVFCYSLKAQQPHSIPIEGYRFNQSVTNPAMIGLFNTNKTGAVYSSYWVNSFRGIKEDLTAYGNFHLTERISITGGVCNKTIGKENTTLFYSDFAYHSDLSTDWRLTTGIRILVSHYSLPLTQLVLDDPSDPAFANEIIETALNTGAGILLHSNKYYFGFSVPQILSRPFLLHANNGLNDTPSIERQFIVQGGVTMELNSKWAIHPGLMIKILPNSYDGLFIAANLHPVIVYDDVISIGPSLQPKNRPRGKTLDIAGIYAEVRLFQRFDIGYIHEFVFLHETIGVEENMRVSIRYIWKAG